MAVAGNHREALVRGVEVYTVHHGAQFLLSRGEDGAVDVLRQLTALDDYLVGSVADTLWLGEIVGRLDGQGEMSVEIRHLGSVGRLVNLEGDRLLGEALHSVEDVMTVDGKRIVGITFRQFERC